MKRIVLLSSLFSLLSSLFCFSHEIKVPEVLIEGKDRSHITREKEEALIEFEPKFEEEKKEAPDPIPIDERKRVPEKEKIELKEVPSPEFDFKISYGSYDALSYELQGRQERRRFGYLVGILRSRSSGFKEYGKVFNDFDQDDLYAKTNIYFDKWDLSIRLGHYRKDMYLPYGDEDKKEEGMSTDISLRSKIKTEEASNLYLSLYGATGEKKDLKNPVLNPEVRFNTIWKGQDLRFGAASFQDGLGDYFKIWTKVQELKLPPLLLNLRIGLNRNFIEGLASFSWGAKNMAFNGRIEREIRFPEFNELYLKRDYVRIEKDISETKCWVYRLGVSHKPSPYLKFTGSVFYKEIESLVAWEERDFLFEISQIDKEIFGIDSTLDYRIIKDLSVKLNLSYVDRYIPLKPRLEMGAILNYAHEIADLRLITEYIGTREGFSDYIIVGAEVSKDISPHFTIFLLGETAEGTVSQSYPGHPGKIGIGAKASF